MSIELWDGRCPEVSFLRRWTDMEPLAKALDVGSWWNVCADFPCFVDGDSTFESLEQSFGRGTFRFRQ